MEPASPPSSRDGDENVALLAAWDAHLEGVARHILEERRRARGASFRAFVEAHLDKPWKWGAYGLSCNPAITPAFVEAHPEQRWEWGADGLSRNPSITPAFIEAHLEQPWEWGEWGLSWNRSITPEFVEAHLEQPWAWGQHGLSENSAITPEFVEAHLDKPWAWGAIGLSSNPMAPSVADRDAAHLTRQLRGAFRAHHAHFVHAVTPELLARAYHPDRRGVFGWLGIA